MTRLPLLSIPFFTISVFALLPFLLFAQSQPQIVFSTKREILKFEDYRYDDFCATKSNNTKAADFVHKVITDYQKKQLKNKSIFNQPAVIPVYAHVIKGTSGGDEGNITTQQIENLVDRLNRSFSGQQGGVDTNFRFTLANLDYTISDVWFNAAIGSSTENRMKRELYRGGQNSLNIYFRNFNSSTLGIATFPWDYLFGRNYYLDGVVIDYRRIQQLDGNSDVPVHEIGHWLGLYHVFQGECTSPNDFVDDTPAQKIIHRDCPIGADTCPQSGADPIHNFMGYTSESCLTEFTAGQKNRMQATYGYWREIQNDGFRLGINSIYQNIQAGDSAYYSIKLIARGKQAAELSITGLPPNSTANIYPSRLTTIRSSRPLSELRITTSANTPVGTYIISVRGTSASTQETQIALEVSLPQVWAMAGRTPQHNSLTPFAGPTVAPASNPRWTFTSNGALKGGLTVASNGVIYFASDKLYALNPDGTQFAPPVSGNFLLQPVVDDINGNVYALTNNTSEFGWQLYRYNRNLTNPQQITFSNTNSDYPSNIIVDTHSVAGTGILFTNRFNVYLFYPPYDIASLPISNCVYGVGGLSLSRDGKFYYVNCTGSGFGQSGISKINRDTGETEMFQPMQRGGLEPVIDLLDRVHGGYRGFNGTTYFGGYLIWDSNLQPLYAEEGLDFLTFTSGRISILSDGKSSLRLGYADQNSTSLFARGNFYWNIHTSTPNLFTTDATIDRDGRVYIGRSNELVCINQTDGNILWTLPVSSKIVSQPVITPTGTIYFSDENGKVYAY